MNLMESQYKGYQRIALSGEVDLHNSSQVKQVLLEHIRQDTPVVVDLSELSYIDSSGMATLVEALNEAKERKVSFCIAGAKGAPLQVFELTRLDSVFDMYPSLEQVPE